jgi:transcriptional regulator
MYLPAHFEETRVDVLRALMHEYPLGTLVTLASDGLNANHIPFEFDPEPAPSGTLRCHVSRNNPVWRELDASVEPLVVFQGPQAYISPSWYHTKHETGKVVPTYNYLVVHAYGRARAVEDKDWLRSFVTRLTDRFEGAQQSPWKVTDAPRDYIEGLLNSIVGIEIEVSRFVGKWKASQNRSPEDRRGVVNALSKNESLSSLRRAIE